MLPRLAALFATDKLVRLSKASALRGLHLPDFTITRAVYISSLSGNQWDVVFMHPISRKIWLGCNAVGHIDRQQASSLIAAALDLGITRFDTADVYAGGASEEELGRLLPADRSLVSVATKFGHPASVGPDARPCSADHVRSAVEKSLRRLRAERIDVCLIHFPDPHTPYDETLDALQRLIQTGKIAAYGVSNFRPSQLAELLEPARLVGIGPPAMVQEEYNLLNRDAANSLMPLIAQNGLALVPFFPLASGLLTGKYVSCESFSPLRERIVRNFGDRFLHDDNLRRVAVLQNFCTQHGVSMIAVALQWLFAQPGVSALAIGASSAEQLKASTAALENPLSPDLLSDAARVVAALGRDTGSTAEPRT